MYLVPLAKGRGKLAMTRRLSGLDTKLPLGYARYME